MTVELSAADVGQAFLALYHRMSRLVDDAMTATGLSLSRAKVLKQLQEFGPMNQAALAGRLGFAPRSVTDALETLVRERLVTRTPDPEDGRARIVAITATGSAALARAMIARNEIFETIFSGLDALARADFVARLQNITTCLTAPAPPPPSGECLVE